jgi:hypothetical protein
MVAQTATAVSPRQPDPQMIEHDVRSLSGLRMLVLVIATSIFVLAALTPVVPGRARVVQLFGRYRGTIRDSGLQWVDPFTRRIAVGARQPIVEGAVGMVQLALQRLQDEDVVELDEERKASMVSNLLVVLCSEQATQPIVNTGTLYQ